MNKQDLSVAEALERVLATVSVLGNETVELLDSLGRVLAEDVVARDSLPPFDNSSMDGFAVVSADLQNTTEDSPATLRVVGDVAAGTWPDFHLSQGQAARIMTGAPIPAGADAVVPVEGTDENWREEARPLPEQVKVFRRVERGGYIRPQGDDIQAGRTILRVGHRIRPQEISVLASLGVPQLSVVRRARVGILATGDELVPVKEALSPGKIRNSNSYAQSAQVAALGAIPIPLGVARDTEKDVRIKLQTGLDLDVDMFISSAGVSVGAYDVVKTVLSEGGDVNFWRVRMRPGKPLAFGKYAGVPYIGLPGNPVSSMVSFERFAKPAIRKMMGETDLTPHIVQAIVQDSFGSDGRESYIRVILEQHADGTHATTTGNQGSHVITSLVKANGLLIVPEGVREVQCGERLTAILL